MKKSNPLRKIRERKCCECRKKAGCIYNRKYYCKKCGWEIKKQMKNKLKGGIKNDDR